MSPRAAWRLESIGFTKVYDYVAGKADWGSFGLLLEGTKGARAGEHVRADVPTCRLEERLQDVRRVVSAAGWDTCIVVNSSASCSAGSAPKHPPQSRTSRATRPRQPGPARARP